MCGDQLTFCLKLHVDALWHGHPEYTRSTLHVTPVADVQVGRYAATGERDLMVV